MVCCGFRFPLMVKVPFYGPAQQSGFRGLVLLLPLDAPAPRSSRTHAAGLRARRVCCCGG
jgi:hypothetical protein